MNSTSKKNIYITKIIFFSLIFIIVFLPLNPLFPNEKILFISKLSGDCHIKNSINKLEKLGLYKKIYKNNIVINNDADEKIYFNELPSGKEKINYCINILYNSGKTNFHNKRKKLQKIKYKRENCILIFKKNFIDSNLLKRILSKNLSSSIKEFSIDLVKNGIHLKGRAGLPLSVSFNMIIEVEMNSPNIIDLYLKEIEIVGIGINLFRNIIFDYIRNEFKISNKNIQLKLIEKDNLKGIRIIIPTNFKSKKMGEIGELSKIKIDEKKIRLFIKFF